jgi:hypothetical protein
VEPAVTEPVPEEPAEEPPAQAAVAKPKERKEKPIQLTTEEVKAVMKRAKPMVGACFDRHRPSLPAGGGKVEFELTVANSGTVKASKVVTSGLEANPVSTCIMKVHRAMKFPRNLNDPPMSFTVPYSYAPAQ